MADNIVGKEGIALAAPTDAVVQAQEIFSEECVIAAEYYAVTTYLLFVNGIIGAQDVMDARTVLLVRCRTEADPRPHVGKR